MPVVHVNVWEGFGEQKAKTVIQGITEVFVDLGIPTQAVQVIVHEIPKSFWGIGGDWLSISTLKWADQIGGVFSPPLPIAQ